MGVQVQNMSPEILQTLAEHLPWILGLDPRDPCWLQSDTSSFVIAGLFCGSFVGRARCWVPGPTCMLGEIKT